MQIGALGKTGALRRAGQFAERIEPIEEKQIF
jgi:hypothetical protein